MRDVLIERVRLGHSPVDVDYDCRFTAGPSTTT